MEYLKYHVHRWSVIDGSGFQIHHLETPFRTNWSAQRLNGMSSILPCEISGVSVRRYAIIGLRPRHGLTFAQEGRPAFLDQAVAGFASSVLSPFDDAPVLEWWTPSLYPGRSRRQEPDPVFLEEDGEDYFSLHRPGVPSVPEVQPGGAGGAVYARPGRHV
jgi:hypothetical protein